MQPTASNAGFTKRLFRRQGASSPAQSPSEGRKMVSLPKQTDSEPASLLGSTSSFGELDSPPMPVSQSPAAKLDVPTTSAATPSPRVQRMGLSIRASLDQPDAQEEEVVDKRPSFCSLEDPAGETGECIVDDPESVLDGTEAIEFSLSMDIKQGPGTSSKFPLKKLRPKPLSTSSSVESPWKSIDSCTWRSIEGCEVQIRGSRLECLSEVERQALAKIAMHRLQKAQLGCSITRPKDNPLLKQRRQKYQKKKAHTVNVVEKRQSAQQQPVFGVPLWVCIENDQRQDAEQRCKSLDLNDTTKISPQTTPQQSRLSSCDSSKSSFSEQLSSESLGLPPTSSSKGSLEQESSEKEAVEKKYTSTENLLLPVNSSGQSSPTRLSLSPRPRTTSSTSSSSAVYKGEAYLPHAIQVPKIVEACTTYLKKHGLSTVGIFRVDGSAKRCRQLRVMLDSGREIIFSDSEDLEHQPQDIATLLKQYLRDLPDPLLTQELYNAFLAVAKLSEDRRVEILRYLLALLPNANSDTLLVLLKFLEDVTKHSFDTVNEEGILVSGNRMNARNLATIFAPSLLRSGSTKPQQNLADSELVIDVVETMISDVEHIFMIPVEIQHQIYKVIQEFDPEGLDRVIRNYRERESECQEELQTTVFYTSQEEFCPEEVVQEEDGATVIKTKQISTHRIIYKVHKPSDRVLISRSTGDQDLGTIQKYLTLSFKSEDM